MGASASITIATASTGTLAFAAASAHDQPCHSRHSLSLLLFDCRYSYPADARQNCQIPDTTDFEQTWPQTSQIKDCMPFILNVNSYDWVFGRSSETPGQPRQQHCFGPSRMPRLGAGACSPGPPPLWQAFGNGSAEGWGRFDRVYITLYTITTDYRIF